ncbi:MAG: DJ-1/PfpI family protein [Candidatus Binatia bacterium]
MVGVLAHVNLTLAQLVAEGLGVDVNKKLDPPLNMSVPADGDAKRFQPKPVRKPVETSSALSMANTIKAGIKRRKVALLAADGFQEHAVSEMKDALIAAGAQAKIIAPTLRSVKGKGGTEIKVDFSLLTAASVIFDAIYVPDGEQSVDTLKYNGNALHFVNETYKHRKAIAASGAGAELLRVSCLASDGNWSAEGVIIGDEAGSIADGFIEAIAAHRHWGCARKNQVPA